MFGSIQNLADSHAERPGHTSPTFAIVVIEDYVRGCQHVSQEVESISSSSWPGSHPNVAESNFPDPDLEAIASLMPRSKVRQMSSLKTVSEADRAGSCVAVGRTVCMSSCPNKATEPRIERPVDGDAQHAFIGMLTNEGDRLLKFGSSIPWHFDTALKSCMNGSCFACKDWPIAV